MLVHFVTDEPTKIPAIRAMLEPRYHVVPPQLVNAGFSANLILASSLVFFGRWPATSVTELLD
jgi:small basic protein